MPRYVFEGSDMYEVQSDGSRIKCESLYPPNATNRGHAARQLGSGYGNYGMGYGTGHGHASRTGGTYSYTYSYSTLKLYSGVDRAKWPNTWMRLVLFESLKESYKWISEKEWRERTPLRFQPRQETDSPRDGKAWYDLYVSD